MDLFPCCYAMFFTQNTCGSYTPSHHAKMWQAWRVGLIDNLNYTYNANSNKILKVDDASSETASFRDVAGNDYDYWLDGSLKKDNNKDITQIDYNYLKLPKQLFLTGGRWIKYEYDANGTKLEKILHKCKIPKLPQQIFFLIFAEYLSNLKHNK